MTRPKRPLAERFWEKVGIKSEDECWIWQAYKNNMGYGGFNISRKRGMILAHRYALVGLEKPEPPNNLVLHRCDNPACCNPKHLYLGNHFDNASDKVERNPDFRICNRKLYDEEVWLIRKLAKHLSYRKIAPMFKVTYSTIMRAVRENNYPTKGSYNNPNFTLIK